MMEISEMQTSLESIGLSANEAAIYLALAKQGSSKAGKISKFTQLNRTTVYDVLKSLLDKGFVSYIVKGKVKYFEAVNPKQFKELLNQMHDEINKILPSLVKIYKEPETKHNVTLYSGVRGIRSIFENILREAKINYVLDSEGQFENKMPYYAQYFIKGLEKKKVQIKHIVREGRKITPSKTTEVRYIKKEIASEATYNIYNDKIAILIWSDPPEGILIQNKDAANSLKEYFEILWSIAKVKV